MDEQTRYAHRYRSVGGCHWARRNWPANATGWSADRASAAWARPTSSGSQTTESHEGPSVRISDADRNSVVSDLSEHFEAGRLSVTEFQERSEQAMNARTWSDLEGIFADLPPLISTSPERHRHRGLRPWMVIAMALALVCVFAAANFVGSGGHRLWFPWFVFPIGVFLVARRYWPSGRRP
jgi:Domain of unknown function (DUF1707)